MFKAIAMSVLLAVCGVTFAMTDNHPQRNHQLSRWYDDHMCIAVLANQCIDNVCLRSSERDCKEECEKAASAKCAHDTY